MPAVDFCSVFVEGGLGLGVFVCEIDERVEVFEEVLVCKMAGLERLKESWKSCEDGGWKEG
jgi:hypothetical protein